MHSLNISLAKSAEFDPLGFTSRDSVRSGKCLQSFPEE